MAIPGERVVPHSGKMVLIDEVVEHFKGGVKARLIVRDDGLFNDDEGFVPAYLALEYMAQAIAGYAGCEALKKGNGIELGFLLGTRKFESNVSKIAVGTELFVHVAELISGENGLSVFECHVVGHGVEVNANVNVFKPLKVEEYLRGDNVK